MSNCRRARHGESDGKGRGISRRDSRTKRFRKLPYDQKPYWDVERARIGNSRKVPVEVVVNGSAVARKEIDADGQLRDVAFNVPVSPKAVGSRCAFCRLRIPTRFG